MWGILKGDQKGENKGGQGKTCACFAASSPAVRSFQKTKIRSQRIKPQLFYRKIIGKKVTRICEKEAEEKYVIGFTL